MNYLREIELERRKLLEMSNKIQRKLANLPEGHICVTKCREYTQYYQLQKQPKPNSKDILTVKKYISTKDKDAIIALAEKEYYGGLMDLVQSYLAELERFLQDYKPLSWDKPLNDLNPILQKFVVPAITPDDIYVAQWLQNWPEPPNTYPIRSNSFTNKGEHVRSKSEKIIADRLADRGVPYKYECGYRMTCSGIVRYPDFTCLNLREREEVIWEHLGTVDKDDYVMKNMQKLVEYQTDGFIVGKNLIITFENDDYSLDSRILDQIIDTYLL